MWISMSRRHINSGQALLCLCPWLESMMLTDCGGSPLTNQAVGRGVKCKIVISSALHWDSWIALCGRDAGDSCLATGQSVTVQYNDIRIPNPCPREETHHSQRTAIPLPQYNLLATVTIRNGFAFSTLSQQTASCKRIDITGYCDPAVTVTLFKEVMFFPILN